MKASIHYGATYILHGYPSTPLSTDYPQIKYAKKNKKPTFLGVSPPVSRDKNS
jgi:hypothetical protein